MLAIEVETRVRDLQDECRTRGVGGAVIRADSSHDGEVGLRHRLVVERHRHLSPHDPTGRENGSERIIGSADGSRMAAALRLGVGQVTADEFDWIVLKRTEIHQSLVLDAFPPPQSEWRGALWAHPTGPWPRAHI